MMKRVCSRLVVWSFSKALTLYPVELYSITLGTGLEKPLAKTVRVHSYGCEERRKCSPFADGDVIDSKLARSETFYRPRPLSAFNEIHLRIVCIFKDDTYGGEHNLDPVLTESCGDAVDTRVVNLQSLHTHCVARFVMNLRGKEAHPSANSA